MSIQINSQVGEMNSLAPVNVPERNISENTDMLENVAEDTAYDTYETVHSESKDSKQSKGSFISFVLLEEPVFSLEQLVSDLKNDWKYLRFTEL